MPQQSSHRQLADVTTLRLGGPARALLEANSTTALLDAVRDTDRAGDRLLAIAGGSNLVISDEGFDGTAILIRSSGVEVSQDGDDVLVTADAGETWDNLVARAVAEGWSGIECLSGIPGSVGATPIQNVGAYGQEISEVFESASVYDRRTGATERFSAADCRFTYRDSVFKHNDRYIVLDVSYRLRRSSHSAPIRYTETARRLGIEPGETVPLELARQSVLDSRRGKGMVINPDDIDTRSVGSFFINPVVSHATFDEVCARTGTTPPHWPAGDEVKTSAAWLIGQAGFTKGHGFDGVAISSKHTLALTHTGGGSTRALLRLAAEVRDGVEKATGVRLRPEPVLVNATF